MWGDFVVLGLTGSGWGGLVVGQGWGGLGPLCLEAMFMAESGSDESGDGIEDPHGADRCPECHFPGRPAECAPGCTKGYAHRPGSHCRECGTKLVGGAGVCPGARCQGVATDESGDGIPSLGVECGQCGGPVYMVTCDCFSGSGHEWVIVGVCRGCRLTSWTDDGCLDCKAEGERMEAADVQQ